MKSIIISGALGHIGSKLIHSIEPGDYKEVRIIDNLSTQRFASLFNLPKNVNFTFIEDDILDVDLMELTKNMDVMIHLAAITDATASIARREEVELVNYEGTKKVAKSCIKNGVRLLFPSTTSVYGSQSEVVDETCSIEELRPQSPYAEYKLKSEQMLKKMGINDGLKFVIFRFGTIFGTSIGMRFHTAVNKFCWQAATSQPITVWRTAYDQRRPYLGVDDAVRAMKFIISSDLFAGEIMNIVSSNNTVRDIVDIIRKFIAEVEINMVDSEIMNQLSYHVLCNKFEKLGFISIDTIENGVQETLSLLNNQNASMSNVKRSYS